ncbi:nitrate reductase cytochrome c-type subunit [Propionivibrio sp.]|uniref:nitrate reductase cytochrome c-type subunit n=1 Tax=Propionivibrio sp. TaxID=2212460 RepID=UPI0039E6E05A
MKQPVLRFARTVALLGAVAASLCLASPGAVAAEKFQPVRLQTLRGVEINASDPAGEGARFGPDSAPLPRDFVQQPPLIPHTTESYLVSKEFNKCMDCHAWSRAREANATKISITHFKSREGAEMSSVSPNRYFCNQCHVPQTDAKPLVGNVFKPGAGLR